MPRAYTLVELLLVLSILGTLTVIAAPPLVSLVDRVAVRTATQQTAALFAAARQAGLREGQATIEITATGIRLRVRDSVVRRHDLLEVHGVALRSTTAAMTFDHTGLGRGIANGTIILSKRRVADTLVVSRLGRVR
jgi:prepilin-type N-terminal cleavage/methylation domain-containing protein